MTWSVSSIRRLRRHDSSETIALCFFAIHIEKRRIDPQSITRHTSQTLDVKRRAGFRVFANSRNVIRPEYKDIAATGLNKIVATLVYKDLIARVDCPSGNNLAAMTNATWRNIEIMTECLGRGVNEKVLPATDQSRKCKKEKDFLGHNLDNLIILT